ncbi:MAG: ATP-binding protein [Lachnospiraceae bacterium]|nr:ATP-binding protein [Lachnospiraceae bacterium]
MIKRDLYIKKIRPFMDKNVVKVLTGVRRCGKSVMLQLIQEEMLKNGVGKEQMLQINFETKAVDYVKDVDASYQAIKEFAEGHSGKSYLFLDEIQELSGWEKMINSCMIDFDVDIYITGSNAYMLSGELATYLGGRYVEFKIYPFSFAEVMEIMGDKAPTEVFPIYLVRGGMPFLYQFSMDEDGSMQYLEDVYSSIILKDIAQRNRVRDIEQLRRLLLYFISNIGNTFSAGSIMKYLKNEQRSISAETLYNYIDYCQTACLLHLVSREDIMGKRVLQFQEKMYIVDHGFREAIYGSNMRDIDQVLENIVYIELCRRGYRIFVGKADAMEVDFIAMKNTERIYVQVTYLLASEETMEREFGVLEKIPDNYPKYVVSMDEIDRGRNGIKHMNIRNFLLSEELK